MKDWNGRDELLARIAVRVLGRHLVGGGLEMDIAVAAFAAGGDDGLLAVLNDVGELASGLGVEHLGAARHGHHEVLAAAAVHLLAASVHAVFGEQLGGEVKGDQGIGVAAAPEDHVAAASAVAAVRAAFRNAGLAPETAAPVAALAGAGVNSDMV